MRLETIGYLALNLATSIYLFWLLPQLIHTFKCRQTATLSLFMHSLLMLGYLSDLVYVVGQHLPQQCLWVNLVGLLSLLILHGQFWIYNPWTAKTKKSFMALTLLFALLFMAAIYSTVISKQSVAFYNFMGLFSCFCWLSYLWPQIAKNFARRSTAGLSQQSLYLSALSGLADLVAAFALHFAWPSKVGSLLGLLPKGMMLLQFYYYKKQPKKDLAYAA